MKRAVITGATGAIGTALIRALLDNGVEVLVITRPDSKRNDHIPKVPGVKVIFANLSDFASLDVSAEGSCDVFFHLAWAGASGAGRNDIYLQLDNIRYSLDAVRLAKRLGCHTFIGAGSQAEYGLSDRKLTADTPTKPFIGYGFAKLCAGQMTREYAHQQGLRHIWTRILSVYGPNDGANSMISMLVRNLTNRTPVDMTAGTQIWDYLYSSDAAKALYLLAEKGQDGKTYVLGSGTARPLKEYAEIIREEIGSDIRINYGAVPFSKNQVMYLCADILQLVLDTGWSPKTEFREGIRKILDHMEIKSNE